MHEQGTTLPTQEGEDLSRRVLRKVAWRLIPIPDGGAIDPSSTQNMPTWPNVVEAADSESVL